MRKGSRLGQYVLRAWIVLVIAFLFTPIVIIVIYSFNRGRALISWNGFGINWYRSLIENHAITNAIQTSLKAALGATVIATVLGSLAGIALARRPGRWSVVFLACIFLVLVTPEIVDAVALLIWYVRIKGPFAPSNTIVNYGLVRLAVGHSIFSMGVVTLIVRARLLGLDSEMEEAAADLYASPMLRFRDITLPLVAPAIMAGALLAFSLSMDDTIISAFVSVAGNTPWPVFVFSATHAIMRPDIAAMSAVMFLVTLSALGLSAYVLTRGQDAASGVAAITASTAPTGDRVGA